jgi:hypothetical protein
VRRFLTDVDRADLDEIRRLMYMAQYLPLTDHAELVGTLVNAIVHHQNLDDDADTVAQYLIAAMDPDATGHAGAVGWLNDRIDVITARLER